MLLLGMGFDMLYMAGGGRITRLHGPFVSDAEVDTVARFLRSQGKPDYVPDVTAMAEEDEEEGFGGLGGDGEGADLYDQAVAIVTRADRCKGLDQLHPAAPAEDLGYNQRRLRFHSAEADGEGGRRQRRQPCRQARGAGRSPALDHLPPKVRRGGAPPRSSASGVLQGSAKAASSRPWN